MGYSNHLKNGLYILTAASLLLAAGFFAWSRLAPTNPGADNTTIPQSPASSQTLPLIDQQPRPPLETATFALG